MDSEFSVESGELKIFQNGRIEFNQKDLSGLSEETQKIQIKYNGLCEIICNYILLNDMLGPEGPILTDDIIHIRQLAVSKQTLVANFLKTNSSQRGDIPRSVRINPYLFYAVKNKDKFQAQITGNRLQTVQETHYLDVIGFISKLIALVFSIYPCNLFSNVPFYKKPYLVTTDAGGQQKLVVNEEVLSKKLSELSSGFYIKLFVFKKVFLSVSGHSTLIKKLDDNTYAFFDPDKGEYTGLNFNELVQRINEVAYFGDYNEMLFLDAAEFLNSYQRNQNQEGFYNYMPEEMNENAPELIIDEKDEISISI